MRFLLLTGDGHVHGVPPRAEWDAEAVRADLAHRQALAQELSDRGELVDTQHAGEPAGARVVESDGLNPPVVREAVLTTPPVSGYWVVDVASEERALEIAGRVSAAPGPSGRPTQVPVEVRAIAPY
jgi:hypothetical protein